jgi:FixJ family two-component response regulator
MMIKPSLLCVVDDDESVRESLPELLRAFGYTVRAFSSAEEFLASDAVAKTSCLIADVVMPGLSGPALQGELARRNVSIPIVFITAHGRDDIGPRVIARGAAGCLSKPFTEDEILGAVQTALQS